MGRKLHRFCVWLLLAVVAATGCAPVQPFYLKDTGNDLTTFLDTATEIQYADIEHQTLDDVSKAYRPRTIAHPEFDSMWDLTLEEAVATALQNSKVIRSFGQVRQFGQIVGGPPERLSASPDAVVTIYDPAILETGQSGVAQALAQFDAIFNSNLTWDRTDRLQNLSGFTAGTTDARDQQDRVIFNNELTKRAATGQTLTFRNQTIYENILDISPSVPNGARLIDSNWFTAFEAEVRQPLLRSAGTQVNRVPVVLARIRTDISLSDFEFAVRNMMNEIETAYWELYFFYRNLDAAKLGRDSALSTWKRIYALSIEKAEGGEAQQEAQAREQYFFFRSRVEEALRDLYKSETRLRYLMGLGANDGRLVRPSDEPTRARVSFGWDQIHGEALTRSVELRRQHWRIKTRELELIAARNQLLPQFDVVGLYRWLGQGDGFNSLRNTQPPAFPNPGSQAIDGLMSGNFQEGQLGFQASVPIGFRRELAQVRSSQLSLAREKAKLEDMELEISHQLTDAIADLESQQMLAQTHFSRLVAAGEEVKAMEAAYDAGTVTLDRLLDAQRRRADAEVAFYQALVEYNLAIVLVHFRKGSLLDYNGVVLAEGPWPAKAYCDAHERARRRAASEHFDYGYSRPRVVSRGPIDQHPGVTQGTVREASAHASAPLTGYSDVEVIESPAIVIEDGASPLGDAAAGTDQLAPQGADFDPVPNADDSVPSIDDPVPFDSLPLEPSSPGNPTDGTAPPQPSGQPTLETKGNTLRPVRRQRVRGTQRQSTPIRSTNRSRVRRPDRSTTKTQLGERTTNSRVSRVTFVEDAPEPKPLAGKKQGSTVDGYLAPEPDPSFEIRDPATDSSPIQLQFK